MPVTKYYKNEKKLKIITTCAMITESQLNE